MFAYACVYVWAQTPADTIRYVNAATGAYTNDGRSWATAKDRLQDAINDLRDYLVQNHLTSGSVYVAAGTYVPTESTEASGGSMLNTSFKIYNGVHVYGGFNPDTAYARVREYRPGLRIMSNDRTVEENWAGENATTSGVDIASQWDLKHKTILSGNHSSTPPTFTFDSIRGRYNTAYPASSFHVVWFATNGIIPSDNDSTKGHYKALDNPASLDGCVISSGNASTKNTTTREHTAYGGGVYMVGNSSIRACIVERCNATLRGGGIYADGGGIIEFCLVQACQSVGVGVYEGYGGGVCIDHEGAIGHSHITACAARCGAGLFISHVPSEYPVVDTLSYSPFATACVVNNNTASAEAGGIYLAEGGTVNHCTVTANNCISPDVTYYGRRHGRSGGIYVRDCGMIFNSVFWGNRCLANNDIQFATIRQVKGAAYYQVFVYHSAFMNHDISDWTGVTKEFVFSLDRSNLPYEGTASNHPCFFSPTVDPNNWRAYNPSAGIYGPGVFQHLNPVQYPGPRIWHLTSYSAIDQKGVQATEDVQNVSPWLIHAHTDYGVVSNPYEPVSTLGALVRQSDPVTYELVEMQGLEGRKTPGVLIPTLFVDPNRKGVFDNEGKFDPQSKEGDSWDVPIRDLGEAVSFFRKFLILDDGGEHHYKIPNLDPVSGMPTSTDSTEYDFIQILVKEGTLKTVGPGNYLDWNMRSAAIRMGSHMRLYGGYPGDLTGTNTTGRNPRSYKSYITANITGVEGEKGYANNSAHVIALVNAEHCVVDGFTLSDANTHNVYGEGGKKSGSSVQSVAAGGGIVLNNATTPQAERIDMVGNEVRNCVINNCTSPKGAGIYINGEHPKANGEISYAELKIVNTVIRNNKADYTVDNKGKIIDDHGVITANGRAYVHIDHCTVANNVGYPFKADNKPTSGSGTLSYHGRMRVDNSIVFCNGDKILDNRDSLRNHVTSVNENGQNYVYGTYNMFDSDLILHDKDRSQPHGFFQNGFVVPDASGFLPAGVTTDVTTLPSDSATRRNACIFTREDPSDKNYPTFQNPARNVGNTPNGDKPLYGGIVAYLPLNTNPCVNAANPNGYSSLDNFDRSDVITRDRGGAPDLGAIENTDLPAAGTVLYVTPDGAGRRDGSSWDNAIAGNTVYRLYNAPAAEGDSVDVVSNARLINKSTGLPVTTEDNRYCGGYSQKYIYPVFWDFGKAYTRNIEINAYVGGQDGGLMDTLSNDTIATSSLPSVKYNNGTIPSNIVSEKAINVDYPYGEMSGASRYIYRAQGNYSPVSEDGSTVMVDGTVPNNAAEVVASGRLILTNERKENYVSGLQYAVEKASQFNKSVHKDTMQVWIGAGKYTDYKGYVMRDSVSVYGGFPAGKYAAPGMSERQALMSNVISIPKSAENMNKDAADYETILQISDINPWKSNTEINTAAIKFNDNGKSVKLNINNNISRFTDNNTIHYYQWNEGAGAYELDHTDNFVINTESVRTTWSDAYYDTDSRTRNFLRKRVLQMPDVTSTVYAHGLGDPGANNRGKYLDNLSHYERVIKASRQSNVKEDGSTVNGRHQDSNYKEYNRVYWDGFTIRHGFLYNTHMAHSGGAGVQMFEGGRLVNCIITNNFVGCRGAKGAGVFCDGSTSTIENCFILNNTLTNGKFGEDAQLQGGGLFLYEGTCFNSLIANNYAKGPGGGLGLCVAKFYNNTLAYNTSGKGVGGLRIATGSAPAIFMANTIIYGNSGLAIDITDGKSATAPFINCYIQSATQITKDNFLKAINDHTEGVTDGNFGRKNTLLNKTNPSAANTPFAADVASGTYSSSNPGAKATNNYALRQVEGIQCINSGEEDFEGAMYAAVRTYLQRTNASLNPSDANIRNNTFYKNVVGVELPSNDVVFAKRVQDCQVDVGAYEFNAAYAIKPDTTTHPGKAIFYVTYSSPGGDASACSPHDGACLEKLQQIFDAAGRYKYSLMTAAQYDTVTTIRSGWPSKDWSVEVWMEGDSIGSRSSDIFGDHYITTRSTKHSRANYSDNTLDYSFIIPHGILVKGGFTEDFYHYENEDGEIVPAGTVGSHIVDERDPLTFRTVMSGKITSSTGAEGNTFHVVTFTDDLFDYNEKIIGKGNQLDTVFAALDSAAKENNRVVLDGLFIEDGHANAPDDEDRVGAACVVTEYAHIRNCVIQNNNAEDYGGGLYLKPLALVSGTIIKNNKAEIGGGVYVEAHPNHSPDSLAHVFSTTICDNTASSSAGGMWFENADVRVNSTVLWHNTANDNANVSGLFSRTNDTIYPFSYCAVESRRLEGPGNIELSPTVGEGVRWDSSDPFNSILYYPITLSSTLSRAGMTYGEWDKALAHYSTLDSIDIAGVSRKRWSIPGLRRNYGWGNDTLVVKNNDFIEIGARALNNSFEIKVDQKYVLRRLYVMHTDLLNSDAALVLQENMADDSISNVYRQMGSCVLNPFHRLGDAFDYIIAARKGNPDKFRDTRFEVFVEQGTYYPYHNAYGEQDQVRTNTFLIPEGTTVIGGVNMQIPEHYYGQDGYVDRFSNTIIGDFDHPTTSITIPTTGYSLVFSPTDSIRLRDENHRPMRDNNLNSVIEPWELERQTILSGNAVSGDEFTHVYHVVTIHADSAIVGPQPHKYRTANSSANWRAGERILSDTIPADEPDSFINECALSILARTIELDGLQITGGYANKIDTVDTIAHHYHTKTYFRGGGILVDGNWTQSFDDPNDTNIPFVTTPAKYNLPLLVQNCFFTDNMASNGGAIHSNGGLYVYGSHFTQNYSRGPMSSLDQQYIPWSAGGCIAANAYCGIANTLFANNEARRGLYPIIIHGDEGIPDADARQGFGGALSISQDASMRVVNCHFVRNKAVAYSAIYNFLSNNRASTPDSMQFAFNTIFWGNEVFDVETLSGLEHVVAPLPESETAFATKYKASRAGVFHYDGDEWSKYERLFHEYDSTYRYWFENDPVNYLTNGDVVDKLDELRAQGDKMEGLYFCSYRKGYGPTGMKPTKDGYLLHADEVSAFRARDSRAQPVPIDPNTLSEDFRHLFTYVHGNYNTLINRINTATDGPNFKQPTYTAGIDGYMQNADWLQARMNLTTDQGWGHLKQEVGRDTTYYITEYTGTDQFSTRAAALAAAQAIEPSATNLDVYPILGLPFATFEGVAQGEPALYNYFARQFATYTGEANPPMPLADQYYMTYTLGTSDTETVGKMDRISRNPKVGEYDTYIDLGIYEYQNVQLDIDGQEIDTMWVATKEKGAVHDGMSWETPTADLQWAIDMLMSSHNNHDKYICLMGDDEGSYSPNNVLDNRRAFVISSNSLAPLLPDSAEAGEDYGVRSLTFLGGYNYSLGDASRDPAGQPTVLSMPYDGDVSHLNQLVVVEDMTREHVQANWQGYYTSRDSVVIPITFDGITFINPYSTKEEFAESIDGGLMNRLGGAAIYYRWQRQYENSDWKMDYALHPDSALIDGVKTILPKLTLSNCNFMDNGDREVTPAELSPAVRIDHGGGSTLVVNSLFHSNAGAPIYAQKNKTAGVDLNRVPNNVHIINSTFALNGGHLTLESENSEVHNSLIWLDDLSMDTLTQLEVGTEKWGRATIEDANRLGIKDHITHNAIWACFMDGTDTLNNESLASNNTDVFEGPNFVAPDVTAATAEERRARDFRLNPGARTMNMADTMVYRSHVFFRTYPDTSTNASTRWHWRRPEGFKLCTIRALANDSDLAAKPRLFGKGMERGAYECRAVLQRVVYVDPAKSASEEGDGSTWQNALGHEQLQNALDLAAIYTYLNRMEDAETRRAYVYVKGSYNASPEPGLVARDGVLMYGGLPSDFMEHAFVNENQEYSNAECRRYLHYVRALSSGVASPEAVTHQSRISSLDVGTTAENFRTGFLVDGFVFTNPDQTLTKSPVILNNDSTVIRNCLFVDNKMADGVPVADIQDGLVYNCLFYGDSASVIMRVGEEGLALNNTIVAAREGDVAIDSTSARVGAMQNILMVNATDTSSMNCFAPYLTSKNPYLLPSVYYDNYPALAFQFHEHSPKINAGVNQAELPDLFNDYIADKIVDFDFDRDVLGNPRKIGARVDLGAFETWRVEPNTAVALTAITYRLIGEQESTSATEENLRRAFRDNNGGHRYPHAGSVVYLMDSSAMTMQYEDLDFVDFHGTPFALSPGYVLLKQGASFYGNGHLVSFRYVAAEKRFVNQRYSMTSFPFDYSIENITSTSYNSERDSMIFNLAPVDFHTYHYSGAARSAKDYMFQTENSTLWQPISTATRTATEGYLMDFDSTIVDTLLRFTSFALNAYTPVYIEDDVDKIVYLDQYDHRTAGEGTGLDFTRQEDMGWNMKGLPWLVSDYRTDTLLEEDNFQRQMFIPHVLYQMDGAGDYILSEGDKVWSARSWDRGTTVSIGNAFLLQTATTQPQEAVYFHLPYYALNNKVGRQLISITAKGRNGRSVTSDILTIMPDENVSKTVRYTYGRDAIKWFSSMEEVQFYLLDDKKQSRISLLGAAPTEVDIPLGVKVPAEMDYTFSLPEKEAFGDYGYVWLIDYAHNHYTNLLDEDYTVALEAGENNTRFAVRIGGYPKTDESGRRQYVVFASDGMLYVRGLVAGDRITVYSPSGQLVTHATATTAEWSMPLFYQSGYVVKVNNKAYKVLNM